MMPAKLSLRVLRSSHCSLTPSVGVQRKVTVAPVAVHVTSGAPRLAGAARAPRGVANNATAISPRDKIDTANRRAAAIAKPRIAAIVHRAPVRVQRRRILGSDTKRSLL